MKIYLLKPFRQHKAKEIVDMEPRLAEAVLSRKIGVVAKDTKEEKRAYQTKGRQKRSKTKKQ